MFKLITILAASAIIFSAYAAEPKQEQTKDQTQTQDHTQEQNQTGYGLGFVDENGDGINDNFIDENEDGVCDNDPKMIQTRAQAREDAKGSCRHGNHDGEMSREQIRHNKEQ